MTEKKPIHIVGAPYPGPRPAVRPAPSPAKPSVWSDLLLHLAYGTVSRVSCVTVLYLVAAVTLYAQGRT